jgi:hypothetical protein
MAQAKYTLYKYVKLSDGGWRYCRAALYKNHTIKPNTAIVGGKEEAHAGGDYYIAHDGRWINVGAHALAAQRQRHRLLAGGTTVRVPESDTGKYKLVTIPSSQPQEPVADGRKEIKDEITRHLDDMVASKRPAKSVRMHRNFLNALSDASKPYCDEYGRDDVLAFRNRLVEERYGHKYIDTQMNTVITFFKRWLKMPICMEQKDWLETPPNPPEPYQDCEVVAMEKTATGIWNLLVRLYRSSGCRLQEITHLRGIDVNPYTKTIFIHEKTLLGLP